MWLAVGYTDMRRGMNGLALQVQETLRRDPHGGDLYVFRGKRGNLVKILWHDGLGMSLYAKRLERGRFISYGLCQSLWPRFPDRPCGTPGEQMNTTRIGEDARCLRRSLRLLCGG